MKICGLNKTTLLDYPGHLAATVFTGGCNFRCPFCHNSSLIQPCVGQYEMAEEEVFSFFKKRQGILEGICVTGGEPTLQPDLEEFLERVKTLGYLVKLDTNGSRPQVLNRLLEKKLLDYAAMDVKASRKHYDRAVGLLMPDVAAIEESVTILMSAGIPYEFRTTVVKGIHTEEDFEDIGRWLEGCQGYYLQAYQENENVLQPGWEAFSPQEMKQFAQIAGKYIDKVVLRGLE